MNTGNMIAPGLRLTLGYADKLVQTIPADIFSHMPRADLNSAGFCIGHLALYASAVAGMLGHKELGDAPAGYVSRVHTNKIPASLDQSPMYWV